MIALLYLLTIPVANWMIGNVGVCHDGGACLVPVGFGLMAPSGVLMVGASLVLRDMVQAQYGDRLALACIAGGVALSAALAPPAIVLASAVAFALSELADMAVYTPLRRKGLWLACLASGAVGAVVDSAVFLWLAFGSLDFIAGQVVGKLWMTAAGAAFLAARAALMKGPRA